MPAGTRTFVMKFLGDTKGLLGELDKIEGKMAGMSGKGKLALGAGLAAGAGIGAAATAAFTGAVTKAMSYEKAISAVGAVAGASKDELKGLNDTGLRIGKETAFSATEAAMAMEVLAANGVSVKDIMGGAADAAVALAAAGGTDLVTAADLASTSMAVWGLKTKDMGDVVNRMAGAANVSRFGVEDMALAVAQGGGAAATAGVEFGDFTTAMAAIAPSFSSGSDAGTSFKTMMMRMSPSTKEAAGAFRELGLLTKDGSSKFYDAQGNLKSMAEVTQLLHDSTKDLSEEQKTQALQTMFGTDAFRTAAALAKLTGDEFSTMSAKMAGTDAAAVAASRMDNAAGAMEQLKGSIEVIQIEVGQKLLPMIAKGAKFLADFLGKIPTEVFVVVAAIGVFIGAISAIALVILPLVALAGSLGIGIGTLLLVFSGVGIAIAVAIAAGVLLYQNWATIKDRAGDLWEWVTTAFQRIADFVGGIFQNDMVRHIAMFALLFSPAGPLLVLWHFKDQIVAALSGLYEALVPIFGPVLRLIGGIADKIGDVLGAAGRLGMGSPSGDTAKARSNLGITPEMAAAWDAGDGGEGHASGGVVPGPRGSPRWAMVHGGEEWLPLGQRSGSGTVINIHVEGSVHSESSLRAAIRGALGDEMQLGPLGLR